MIGLALTFTGLLLLLRALFFPGRSGKPYRIHVLNRPGGDERRGTDSSDEWPSMNGAEEDRALETTAISENKCIELAVMNDRIIRMLP